MGHKFKNCLAAKKILGGSNAEKRSSAVNIKDGKEGKTTKSVWKENKTIDSVKENVFSGSLIVSQSDDIACKTHDIAAKENTTTSTASNVALLQECAEDTQMEEELNNSFIEYREAQLKLIRFHADFPLEKQANVQSMESCLLVQNLAFQPTSVSKRTLNLFPNRIFNLKASRGNPEVAGAGVVARIADCEVVGAMCVGLGVISNYMAELYGILIGVEWAVQLGYRNILVRTDSSSVISSLEEDNVPWFAQQRWTDVKGMFDSIKFVHTYHEANFAADKMAKSGCLLSYGVRLNFVGRLVLLKSIEFPNVSYFRFK
ncbi:uncharacterized protein LOC113316057 [Papaver somniferum]|uniref:uncharacterized protein LOC113316057 n=1 Tax=Papaver somniferum TaxID=3469 RepID=UPI000E7042CF|nr:uncharacterized protein LOC113316057 [Papaver somniferum]